MKYYVYMLRCEDNSLYTGIAINYLERFKKHLEGKGAKYTKVHKPIRIELLLECENRSAATKVELFLKSKSKNIKEQIIMSRGDIAKIVLKSIEINVKEKIF